MSQNKDDVFSDNVDYSLQEGALDEFSFKSSDSGDSATFVIIKIHKSSVMPDKDVPFFIPNVPINVSVPNAYTELAWKALYPSDNHDSISLKEKTINKLNPYIYEVRIQHGIFEWVVFRRYKDFASLRDHVLMKIASLKLPIPTKKATKDRRSFREESNYKSTEKGRKRQTLPGFPKKMEILVTEQELENRRKLLEQYLQSICGYKNIRDIPEMARFLEVSKISFIQALGVKSKEDYVKKRCGGRYVFKGCLDFFNQITFRWLKRWLFIKDNFIAYIHTHSGRIGDVILMDGDFTIKSGLHETGQRNGLIITNKTRRLVIRCATKESMFQWATSIKEIMETTGKEFIMKNPNTSFAPIRPETYCRWYVDGEDYMSNLADALDSAKEEIYLTGWWITPELQLKRPDNDNLWDLMTILKRKAEDGVFIFVLLFKEIPMALNNNSLYTKRVLSNLHPNIQVLRHPDHLKQRVFLWSHHEKFVVIDQKIAFLGGIDLCYGRWDTRSHPIHDITKIDNPESKRFLDSKIDKNNRMLAETLHMKSKSRSFFRYQSERTTSPRRFTINTKFTGIHPDDQFTSMILKSQQEQQRAPARLNIQSHYAPTALQNNSLSNNNVNNNLNHSRRFYKTVLKIMRPIPESDKLARDLSSSSSSVTINPETFTPPDSNLTALARSGPYLSTSSTTGSLCSDIDDSDDYSDEGNRNHIFSKMSSYFQNRNNPKKCNRSLSLADQNNVNLSENVDQLWIRSQNCSNPSEENAIKVAQVSSRSLFMGKDYVNWIVKDCSELDKPHDDLVDRMSIPRMPWHDLASSVYGKAARDIARHFIQRWNAVKKLKADKKAKYSILLPKSYAHSEIHKATVRQCKLATCQVLRSVSKWSANINTTENSIYNAYIELIRNANHYVYIENQFFISSTGAPNDCVKNLIAQELLQRIIFFHKQNKKFRVYILIPLLPAFEAEVEQRGAALYAVLHYNYRSLFRGPNSLIEQLKINGVENPWDYVFIGSLRNFGFLGDIGDSTTTEETLSNLYTINNNNVSKTTISNKNDTNNNKTNTTNNKKDTTDNKNDTPDNKNDTTNNTTDNKNDTINNSNTKSGNLNSFVTNQLYHVNTGQIAHNMKETAKIQDVLPKETSNPPKVQMPRLVTEQIYIHDKLIIVDDLYTIIGSANLNDRSMLGFRDSEMAILFKDEQLIDGEFDGIPVKIGSFSSSLRKSLMSEHIGILRAKCSNPQAPPQVSSSHSSEVTLNWCPNELLNDPVGDLFFKETWCSVAHNNSSIFEKVFHTVPSDRIPSFDDFSEYKHQELNDNMTEEVAIDMLKCLRGNLVSYPTGFLGLEDLTPTFLSDGGLMPEYFWM